MCLSHYGHLNEYSHVLAQKFIAIIKHKKEEMQKCDRGQKLFPKIMWNLTFNLLLITLALQLSWNSRRTSGCLMFRWCMNDTRHHSQQLFLMFLRCQCTEQMRQMYSVCHSLFAPPCLHPSASPCRANPSWPNPSAERAYRGAVLLGAICHPLPRQRQHCRTSSPTVAFCQ